jgi:hypothetical protein
MNTHNKALETGVSIIASLARNIKNTCLKRKDRSKEENLANSMTEN